MPFYPVKKNGGRYGAIAPKTRYPKKFKSYTTTKAATSVSTPAFKKKVLAVVRKVAERKFKVINLTQGSGITSGGLAMDPTGNIVNGYAQPLIIGQMGIAQGVEQEQRIGNTIQNCKLMLSGVVTCLPWSQTTNPGPNPFEVHMVVYKSKKDSQYNSVNWLKCAPANTDVPVDGTLHNTMFPWNKDGYKIVATRKWDMTAYHDNFGGTAYASVMNQNFGKTMHRFTVDCGIASKITYQDAFTSPSNDWVGVGFYVVNVDGTVETSGITRAAVVLDAKLSFTDI